MKVLRSLLLAAAIGRTGFPASLAISTYFKEGFTPTAIASDSQGNIYVAGSAVIDYASKTFGAAVAKLDPKASKYIYLTYFDSAASDQVSAIAVDAAGNAYITGWTTNPTFPATSSTLGTASAGSSDPRSYVTKVSPNGAVIFSVLIGGSAPSMARGIALTPQGQILVSGIATSRGFPTTPGAYSIADSTKHWFLMELDAPAGRVIFSATGIGGSSIVPDAAGNIYLAGSSAGTDYPTTPGAYQTTFAQGHYCFGFCQIGFFGDLQHVTKVDAAASKLIYSTGINDPKGFAGSTTNTGLAVDAAGNAYVTGRLLQAQYPFTVPAPLGSRAYLTKLDAAGARVLFSIPVGGGGVQLDSSGAVYVGGIVSSYDPTFAVATAPVAPPSRPFSWIPQQCWPNNITATSEGYLIKVDTASGDIQDGQWIDGSALGATGITSAGGKIWITGATQASDVPITPDALAPQGFAPGFLPGAYLSAVDFSAANSGPAIGCVLDVGNLSHVRTVAGFQLISIFGANLGPADGVAAPDAGATSLAGVSITFDGIPAQLIYVSASQINLAVPLPLPSREVVPYPSSTVMQLTVNGAIVQRRFPLIVSNLNLFADLSANQIRCPSANLIAYGFQPVAANADGSLNSCENPARFGSTVSFFVHGVGAIQFGFPPASQLLSVQAFVGSCSAAVTSAKLINSFVYKVDVTLPATLLPCAQSYSNLSAENHFAVTLSYNGEPVGPRVVPASGTIVNYSPGPPMPMILWVKD